MVWGTWVIFYRGLGCRFTVGLTAAEGLGKGNGPGQLQPEEPGQKGEAGSDGHRHEKGDTGGQQIPAAAAC